MCFTCTMCIQCPLAMLALDRPFWCMQTRHRQTQHTLLKALASSRETIIPRIVNITLTKRSKWLRLSHPTLWQQSPCQCWQGALSSSNFTSDTPMACFFCYWAHESRLRVGIRISAHNRPLTHSLHRHCTLSSILSKKRLTYHHQSESISFSSFAFWDLLRCCPRFSGHYPIFVHISFVCMFHLIFPRHFPGFLLLLVL